MKRFAVTSVIRDKDYIITRGNEGSEILYLTANPNGEAEVVTINLKATTTARVKIFDVNFADLAIKGRDSIGNTVTKYPVRKVNQKEKGVSTLSAQKIWYDDTVHRLNTDERGTYIGEFAGEDKILVVTQDGHYRLSSFELTSHFEEDIVLIAKFDEQRVITTAYWEGEKKKYYIKRFIPEITDKKVKFISEAESSQLEAVSDQNNLVAEIKFGKEKGKELPDERLNMNEVPVMGMKAQGKPLNYSKVKEVQLVIDPNVPKGDVTKGSQSQSGGGNKLGSFDFEESEKSPIEEFKSKVIVPTKKTNKEHKVVVPPKQSSAPSAPVKPPVMAPVPKKGEDAPPKKRRGPSQTSLDFE
jgi:topoisomerase-4 subunit A